MKTMRGFQIKKRVARFIHRICRRRRATRSRYSRLTQRSSGSGLFGWVKRKAKGLLNGSGSGSGYVRLGQAQKERAGIPKGHLAVYVGQKEESCCRVLVPVIYFNHPLFGRLLSEAEEKFGFDYPGRITIPCPVSEFESVTTKIQAVAGPRRGARRSSPRAVAISQF